MPSAFIVRALPRSPSVSLSTRQVSRGSHLSRSWHVCSEQIGDNVVGVDTINQPLPIVVDEPAGNLRAGADILPVVFLGAPEGTERGALVPRRARLHSGPEVGKDVKVPILGVLSSLVTNGVA